MTDRAGAFLAPTSDAEADASDELDDWLIRMIRGYQRNGRHDTERVRSIMHGMQPPARLLWELMRTEVEDRIDEILDEQDDD